MIGECQVTRIGDELWIDRADPHIWITPEFLYNLHPLNNLLDVDNTFLSRFFPILGADFPNPWFQLERNLHDHDDDCGARPGQLCYRGWLLRITASNRTVIYKIGSYLHLPENGVWQATWPD